MCLEVLKITTIYHIIIKNLYPIFMFIFISDILPIKVMHFNVQECFVWCTVF